MAEGTHVRAAHNDCGAQVAESSWLADREDILACYLGLLRDIRSPLLDTVESTAQVSAQLYNVIDAVAATTDDTGHLFGEVGEGVRDEGLSEAIGRNRASTGVHPSQSLAAAALIFEAALPTMARCLSLRGNPSPELTAGRLLNSAILDRMALAARAYVDYLLEKAYTSTRDERRRLSRELHDVAAPAVALGLQNLELFDLYVESDPQRAAGKLQLARSAMLDALATIRNLSAQSRENVGLAGLQDAIHRYLATVPTDIHTDLHVDGDLGRLSIVYSEELYLIIREAVRNAVDHSRPQHLSIEIVIDHAGVHARVHNDGASFRVAGMLSGDCHVGVDSMRERADLLGARLDITSAPETGTTVSVRIPLPGPGPSRARP